MRTNFLARFWRARSSYEKALFFIFLLTLPFLHAQIVGDGIGYYAYIRSPLIDHNLGFSADFPHPDKQLEKIFLNDHFIDNPITKTGHLPNFYSVGPALLWSPFLIVTHLAVLASAHLGSHIAADGFSWPYLAAMAFASALYAFAGLFFSFALARKFVDELWAFWATIGIWFGTSVPLFIYLLPAWSHAHSIFATSLFFWYWMRTRVARTPSQWLVLGLLSGLMIEVYQINAVFLIAVAFDALPAYAPIWSSRAPRRGIFSRTLRLHLLYGLGAFLALLPALISRQIVFGSPFYSGPNGLRMWNWSSPVFLQVLFSANHGLILSTPILILAFPGLFYLLKLDRTLGFASLLISLVFFFSIACYPWWDGSYGFSNRFFISLTPIFICGLASLFACATLLWRNARSASFRVVPVVLLFVLWNLGLVYQWQTGLMPNFGPLDWQELVYDQFHTVPAQALHDFAAKFYPHANPGK
jgi:hypothetical protein